MIEIKHLSKTFQMKDGAVNALKDIDLTIPDGSIYGIIGMSGAGKSTLVRCINLLERPTAGSVVIEQVFAVPGLGRLLLTSIEGRDEPVARAIVVLLAFAVILCNLAADLLARRIDPRLGSGAGGAA